MGEKARTERLNGAEAERPVQRFVQVAGEFHEPARLRQDVASLRHQGVAARRHQDLLARPLEHGRSSRSSSLRSAR